MRVVHVCDETIRRRMDEFKSSSAANMTRDQLSTLEYKSGANNPALEKMQSDSDWFEPPMAIKKICS